MQLLDSWIERILHFLHPHDAPHPFITPVSLYIPHEVIALLPSPFRDSVQLVADSFTADNMNADDLVTRDMSESTAYLERFSRDELQWLLVKMDERLSELEQIEEQQGRVQHPELMVERSVEEAAASAELERELRVLEELRAMEVWCERAMKADDDAEPLLDAFVQVAELLTQIVRVH